jgi:Fic family protein
MAKWEKYLNSTQDDLLVQLAIAHVEFEALHPFLDGNGRLGRMLIPLFLYHKKLLSAPTFYVSEYLEARRDEYVERLLAVSRDNDWTGWCQFFLKAILKQADSNINRAKAILALYETKKQRITELTKSQYAIRALDFIFDRPAFKSSDFVKYSKIPKPTARRIIRVLVQNDLLAVWRESSGRQPAILGFTKLLNVAEGKSVF